jgi:hypothetical protein
MLILIPVWLVSGFAGISFLRQALHYQSRPAARGWRKYLGEVRIRLLLVAGILLILLVVSGVVWVLIY